MRERRQANWPLVGFFVIAAAFPVGAFIQEFVFNRCSASVLAEVMKEKPEFGCGEFFFNRYQTLLAAFMGAAVALAVVRPVFAQLNEMAKQSSKGAKELAESFATAVDEEIAALKEISFLVSWYALTLHDFDMLPENVDPHLRQETRRINEDIKAMRAAVERNDRRQIADPTVVDIRKQFLKTLDEFVLFANDYAMHIVIAGRSQKKALSRSANKAGRAGKERAEAATKDSDALIAILDQLSVAKWAQVRQLERKAQGIEA